MFRALSTWDFLVEVPPVVSLKVSLKATYSIPYTGASHLQLFGFWLAISILCNFRRYALVLRILASMVNPEPLNPKPQIVGDLTLDRPRLSEDRRRHIQSAHSRDAAPPRRQWPDLAVV